MSVIRGQVIDARGQPLADVRVAFIEGPGALPEIAALSDADGRFALVAPRPGHYRLACSSDAAGSAQAEVAVERDDVALKIRLPG